MVDKGRGWGASRPGVRCELCGTEVAKYFEHFRVPRDDHESMGHEYYGWRFTCAECDTDGYWIEIEMFVADPIKWLSHMRIKPWFDSVDFNDMIVRYQERKYKLAAWREERLRKKAERENKS